MNRPKENPLFPDSLAADGIQGAGAKVSDHCSVEHISQEAKIRVIVQTGVDALIALLEKCALDTDCPPWGFPETLDSLSDARDCILLADRQ